MGRAMLSKSLIQFSVDGEGCVRSLLFDLRPNYGGGNEDNGSVWFSYVQLFATPWTAAGQASLSVIKSQNLLKLISIELMMPSNHFTLCYPLPLLPAIFSSIRVFSNQSVLHIRWPKYWSFSFSISPSNDYSRLISFRIDWFGLLTVQGTLKESSPAPVQKQQFFSAQPSLRSNSHIHT